MRASVRPVQVCLELSIFIILTQMVKLNSCNLQAVSQQSFNSHSVSHHTVGALNTSSCFIRIFPLHQGPFASSGQSRHVAGPRQPQPRPLWRQGGQSELPQPRDLIVHQTRALGEARHGQVQVLSQRLDIVLTFYHNYVSENPSSFTKALLMR